MPTIGRKMGQISTGCLNANVRDSEAVVPLWWFPVHIERVYRRHHLASTWHLQPSEPAIPGLSRTWPCSPDGLSPPLPCGSGTAGNDPGRNKQERAVQLLPQVNLLWRRGNDNRKQSRRAAESDQVQPFCRELPNLSQCLLVDPHRSGASRRWKRSPS
jgi:hypothetical protein